MSAMRSLPSLMLKFGALLLAVLSASTVASAANPMKVRYEVRNVGDFNAAPTSSDPRPPLGSGAYGMNNAGDVVGWSYYYPGDGSVYALLFLYKDGQVVRLGSLPPSETLFGFGWSSYGYAVNDSGTVVGTSATQPGYFPNYPFSWHAGSMTDLFQTLPACSYQADGYPFSCRGSALDINSNGDIVGAAVVAGPTSTQFALQGAFLFHNGTFTDLGSLPGDLGSTATAINDQGEIAGMSGVSFAGAYCCGGEPPTLDGGHAFLYAHGSMRDLGTLGGAYSAANDISENGKVAGFADLPSGERHAFHWSHEGGMRDLGTLGGGFSEATAINRNGTTVVGNSTTATGEMHGFVYAGGKMVDLNDLIDPHVGVVIDVRDINHSGQIAGRMAFTNGKRNAMLLSPTPR
jgi:probable HAF family extracellular repeat protein